MKQLLKKRKVVKLIRIKLFFLVLILLSSCHSHMVKSVKQELDLSNITTGLKSFSLDSLKNITTPNGYNVLKKTFFDTQNETEKRESFIFLDSFLWNNKVRTVSDTCILIITNGDDAINSISSMELILRDTKWLVNDFVSGK